MGVMLEQAKLESGREMTSSLVRAQAETYVSYSPTSQLLAAAVSKDVSGVELNSTERGFYHDKGWRSKK